MWRNPLVLTTIMHLNKENRWGRIRSLNYFSKHTFFNTPDWESEKEPNKAGTESAWKELSVCTLRKWILLLIGLSFTYCVQFLPGLLCSDRLFFLPQCPFQKLWVHGGSLPRSLVARWSALWCPSCFLVLESIQEGPEAMAFLEGLVQEGSLACTAFPRQALEGIAPSGPRLFLLHLEIPLLHQPLRGSVCR